MFNMQQSNPGALSVVIVHKECYPYTAGKKKSMKEKIYMMFPTT